MKTNKNAYSSTKSPWPTKDAMEQVYAMKLWGDNKTHFYSGEGSHLPDIVNPYLDAVTSFLTTFKSPIVVCDLGCGDFNVGRQLVKHTKKYIAVDIVADLINHNRKKYQFENLVFQCMDLAEDDLPYGDCALLRQVLQHVSNTEIQRILSKLSVYKYVIITEHVPEGDFIPNKDIISGQGTRLKKQSGVDVLSSPFHFKVEEAKQLLSVTLNDSKSVIVTTLYKMFKDSST